jgi:hypothetical protein
MPAYIRRPELINKLLRLNKISITEVHRQIRRPGNLTKNFFITGFSCPSVNSPDKPVEWFLRPYYYKNHDITVPL